MKTTSPTQSPTTPTRPDIEGGLILDWQQSRNDELFEDVLQLCRPILGAVSGTFALSLDQAERDSACNLAFYQAAEVFSPDAGCRFTTFLWLICKRRMTTAVTARKRQRDRDASGVVVKPLSLDTPFDGDGEETLADVVADPVGLDPAEAAMVKDDYADQLEHLDSLLTPLEQQTVGGFLAGGTYAEIAALVGRGTKAVDNALQRSRLRAQGKMRPRRGVAPHRAAVEPVEAQPEPKREKTLAEAFEERIQKQGDHWIWCGVRRPHGVGQLSFEGKLYTAMRVSWELAGNPPAPRKGLRRLCGEEWCVNPEHYELR